LRLFFSRTMRKLQSFAVFRMILLLLTLLASHNYLKLLLKVSTMTTYSYWLRAHPVGLSSFASYKL